MTGNGLIDRLTKTERDFVRARAELVTLERGDKLHRQDGIASQVYFPKSAVCSLVVAMADGEVAEAGTVGNEGMLGLTAYLDVDHALHTALTQIGGEAWRLSAAAFRECVRNSTRLDRLMRRYVAYTWRYANQTVACNALHSIDKRACRWLLLMHDRIGDAEIVLTHEFLAEMLGVHRQTVSIVAATLQRKGLIRYRRGVVRVLKRTELERAACECYATSRQLYHELIQHK